MLPNLIIIGAAKCGTTSLHNYLSLHPEIYMSHPIKESHFFVEELHWNKGLTWYKSLFPESAKIIGETSPTYTYYPTHKGVPERMHKITPDAKLIYVVRNPFDQIVSHYVQSRSTHLTKKSFEETLTNLNNNHYVNSAKYYMQIEQYLNYYPRENILVIDSEDLKNIRMTTLRSIFTYLDVNPDYDHPDYSLEHNLLANKRLENNIADMIRPIPIVSRIIEKIPSLFSTPFQRPVINERLRSSLKIILREDIEKLRAFSGLELNSWDV